MWYSDLWRWVSGFFLIGFHKKVSIAQINTSSKDVEYNIDEGFSWVSYDIPTYEGGFQAFLSWLSQKGMKEKKLT
jgi:hypothetical protein